MDFNTLWFDDQELKCKICMGHFNDPVISLNPIHGPVPDPNYQPEIYCEKCLIEWNRINAKSPTNGLKITCWVRIKQFTKLSIRSRIRTNLNLTKLIDLQHQSIKHTDLDLDSVLNILEMIDGENEHRIRDQDFDNVSVFKEIFKHTEFIQNIIKHLIDSEIVWRGTDNWTIGHYVCRFGSIGLIQHMMEQSKKHKQYVPIDINNDKGMSVIHFIFGSGNMLDSSDQLKMIEYMIEQSIDLEIDGKYGRPFHLVCGKTNLNSSDQLKAITIMAHRVDLEAMMRDGRRPIHLICDKSNSLNSSDLLEAIKMMLGKNINTKAMDKNDWTLQHYVLSLSNNLNSSDQLKALIFLVEHKKLIDLNASTKNGCRPIHFVASNCNHLNSLDQIQALEILIEQKVDLDVMTTNKCTPFVLVCSDSNHFNSSDQARAINLLLEAGVDAGTEILMQNKTGDEEWSPFVMISSSANHMNSNDQKNMIKKFVENFLSMDLNIKKSDGWTAMHYIASGQSKMNFDDLMEIIDLLIKQGPMVQWGSMTNDGKRPIDLVFSDTNRMTSDQKLSLIQKLLPL
jgi:hypothetical protein